ncbi:hypothetical protein [Devosia rhizoryzae]|uniref:Uncharacterized protein n=1 Tax=Devosia rhizoryzae TaxID=2774137 RepID=A0ABX7CA12_9HYPH|nr:hypothetical protein [Devosia rhizoryzae]QQR40094.1 hypothetical protein JI748_03515 [Devosia rhizoryzae]
MTAEEAHQSIFDARLLMRSWFAGAGYQAWKHVQEAVARLDQVEARFPDFLPEIDLIREAFQRLQDC